MTDSVDLLRARINASPKIAFILGSGVGGIADAIRGATRIAYAEIPGLPTIDVAGQPGLITAGELEGHNAIVFAGRFHVYEGHAPQAAALPVRIAHALGARTLIVCNAAGGISSSLRAGDLMVITDHVNLSLRNPLIGPVVEGDERFPDMSDPYDSDLRTALRQAATQQRIRVREGIYGGVLGPAYETPAEIRMLARLGADAVGMSTVPEVIAARALGMPVAGVSVITNRAAGLSANRLSHDEVVRVAAEATTSLQALLRSLLRLLPPRMRSE